MEIAGAHNTSPNHQSGSVDKAFGATTCLVDLSPTTVPCFVIGVGTRIGGATTTPATGWDDRYNTPAGQGITVISKTCPTGGNYDPEWVTNSPGMVAVGIAIRAA
jgi:hypothetical protein